MADEIKTSDQASTQTTEKAGSGLLDQVIASTKITERSRAEDLIRNLTQEVMSGTIKYDKNLTKTIEARIAAIDATISKQLAAVLHSKELQRLEGSWRGLNYLIMNSETSVSLKIKLLNISKKELAKDLEKAVEFDQSQLFKKLYETEYGTPGGEPYGALIGDYEFTNHPEDMATIEKISNVSAAAFCPFISAASSNMLGMDKWTDLSKPRDLEKIFEAPEYIKWRSFRETEDSRFVSLVMPRVLSRLPYGKATKETEEFDFEEAELNSAGKSKPVNNEDYTWMNAAYVMGAKMTDSFAKTSFCTSIRGMENGGKVENLPLHIFTSDDGDSDSKCPTEVGITDRREAELSKLGFLPLCHYKNTDHAVFFGAQTVQKPKKYDKPEATANAAISARLPYIMASSRFAHYLKVMARDKIGSFMEASDCEVWLNKWIMGYVDGNPQAGPEVKARYPLRAARVEVKEIEGSPGSYNAVAHLQPWLQMEELTTSLRMVAKIPMIGG